MKGRELLIIIPAYNEGENIAGVLEQLEQLELGGIADILIINLMARLGFMMGLHQNCPKGK